MRKILIQKVEQTTVVKTWNTENPDKIRTYNINKGADYHIEGLSIVVVSEEFRNFPKIIFKFEEIDNNLGTSNITEYCNAMAENGFFVVSSGQDAQGSDATRITRAEAEALQLSSSFIPGAIYTITNADQNLYGGTEITLTAITSNQLSLQGSGLFYCPKYDLSESENGYGIWNAYMQGAFSSILGNFTPNETVTAQNGATAVYLAEGFLRWLSGNWSAATSISGITATANVSGFVSPSYNIGQIVHWGGKSWTNLNGNVGSTIDKYTLDEEWELIPFNSDDYNVYIDEIQYDFGNDMIIYRKDRYNNIVSGNNQVFVELESPDGYYYGNPIKDFQWGCGSDDFNTDDYLYVGISENQVIDSYCGNLNFIGSYFYNNIFNRFSHFKDNNIYKTGYFSNNEFNEMSSFDNNNIVEGNFFANILHSSYVIGNDFISNNTTSNNFFNSTFIGNRIIKGNLSTNHLIHSSIEYAVIKDAGFISSNVLEHSSINYVNLDNSNIDQNRLFKSSILRTVLNVNSSIAYNELINSSIEDCSLNDFCSIQFNKLSGVFTISNNTLTNGAVINKNLLHIGSLSELTMNAIFFLNNTMNNSNIINAIFVNTVTNCEILLTNISEDFSSSTIIYNGNLTKKIFRRLDGTKRLQYVDNSDAIVIANIDA